AEIRERGDAALFPGDERNIDLLEERGDGDDRQAGSPGGEQTLGAARLSECRLSASDQRFGIDIGPTRTDVDLKPLRSIKALVLGQVVACELGLVQPLQAQRQHQRGGRGLRSMGNSTGEVPAWILPSSSKP